MNKLLELWKFRELLKSLVVNELRLRYRRSVLGFLWSMLNPLLMMAVLTFVFSTVMRFDREDYWALLFAGLLPWIFFSQSIALSLMSIVGKGSLLKKVYIPKAIIPLAAVLSCLVNFLLSFGPLLLIMVVMGRELNESLLFLPVATLFLAAFAAGFSFLFSCLNVFFRDFTHMTDVLLQAWFYASPVIYTVDMVPAGYREAFTWNPVYYLLECFRRPILDGAFPSGEVIGLAALSAGVALVVGFLVFVRFEKHFILRI